MFSFYNIYKYLLINRFDRRKEKQEDIEKNIIELNKLVDEGKIGQDVADILLAKLDNVSFEKTSLRNKR